jgi:hypothetical protein
MALIGILFFAAVNCVILYYLSFLAVGGDGSGDGIQTVRIFGYSCIAVATFIGFIAWMRGKGGAGVAISACALPLGYFLAMPILILGSLLG